MGRIAIDFPLDEIRELCREFDVHELALFGSALRDDFHEDSDLDLLVEFEPGARIGLMTLARFQRKLSTALHRKVDLVPKDGLKPLIREEILASAEVLYAA